MRDCPHTGLRIQIRWFYGSPGSVGMPGVQPIMTRLSGKRCRIGRMRFKKPDKKDQGIAVAGVLATIFAWAALAHGMEQPGPLYLIGALIFAGFFGSEITARHYRKKVEK